MTDLLWIPAVLVAGIAQTFRNALQSGLTRTIGVLGATQVRFLYGLPFAALFLLVTLEASGQPLPPQTPQSLAFTVGGALAQIGGTAAMLLAMHQRGFAVSYATIKMEPLLVALFGLLILGDDLTVPLAAAIAVATAGVLLASHKPGGGGAGASWSAMAVGLGAGALFGLASVLFRGAMLALGDAPFFVRSMTTLFWSLAVQAGVLAAWMALADRAALVGSLRHWRSSLGAGALGAGASALWFIGFALTSAANVRTLALIEIPVAALLSRRLFGEAVAARERFGMALIMAGVAALLLLSAQE